MYNGQFSPRRPCPCGPEVLMFSQMEVNDIVWEHSCMYIYIYIYIYTYIYIIYIFQNYLTVASVTRVNACVPWPILKLHPHILFSLVHIFDMSLSFITFTVYTYMNVQTAFYVVWNENGCSIRVCYILWCRVSYLVCVHVWFYTISFAVKSQHLIKVSVADFWMRATRILSLLSFDENYQ